MTSALDALTAGDVIVVPTDTVYGLGCLPHLPDAVKRIFELKGRPDEKPLPVLGATLESLSSVANFDERATQLAREHWPGPLTLVLPRAEGFTYDLGGDDVATVAVRVPKHETILELLASSGPLAVTSANRSGEPPATTIDEARAVFGDGPAAYVDGGICRGVPSTVLSLAGAPTVLREGSLSAGDLLA